MTVKLRIIIIIVIIIMMMMMIWCGEHLATPKCQQSMNQIESVRMN